MILHWLEIANWKFVMTPVTDYDTPLNAKGTWSRYGFKYKENLKLHRFKYKENLKLAPL